MKFMKPHRLEIYSFVFSIPLIAIAINQVMYGDRLWQETKIWLVSVPLIIIIGFFSWYGHALYTNSVEQKFPDLKHSRQRISRKLLVTVFVMGPSILFIIGIYHYFGILGYSIKISHIPRLMAIGISVNLVFETLYEADFIFTKLRESTVAKETMEQLSISQEFDALKNQVNPHFLFNCFNTLSSLITVDKAKAEIFLDELSKVYRYLLRNNEDGLSTLENEIQFIGSYFKLLQTRHGDSVKLNLQIEKRYEHYLLPSLSLQLLVENVVKHNAQSKSNPLVIDIVTTAGNKLVVNNNIQPRAVKPLSNKVGLGNIRAKYKLLKTPGFQVMDDTKNFTVILPLIWNGSLDKSVPLKK